MGRWKEIGIGSVEDNKNKLLEEEGETGGKIEEDCCLVPMEVLE